MSREIEAPSGPVDRPESYARILAGILAVAATLGLIAAFGIARPSRVPRPVPTPPSKPEPIAPVAEAPPPPKAESQPVEPPPPLRPDPEAIARAEAELDAASRDRARADDRAARAAEALRHAQLAAAGRMRSSRTLPTKLRDPSARIARAKANGEAAKAQRTQLLGELSALARAPRPRPKPLVDKSPVARAPDGDEFHFEVRGARVAFIDLEGLLDRVRTDARMQIRTAERLRPISGLVGPVGYFSIQYEMAPDGLDLEGDPFGRRASLNASYSLTGWEIVPSGNLRGETLAQALQPASEFARAINRLNPERDAVTMWVYPDGFSLYRQLRESLHQRGFLVSARPLPDAMPIRGSPSGSLSAAQ